MGRIDDALQALQATEDGTERALQLAGLISTLFKIKNVSLVVIGQLAFDSYANTASPYPEVELAPFVGDLTPRTILEIMRGQLYGQGSLYYWMVAGVPVRFVHDDGIEKRDLCRDFTTDHGVVKLMPVEEIAADRILASVHPSLDNDAHEQAHHLLVNGLADTFHMDWTVLHALCHRPDYRVGEELAKMRLAAKKEVDALGVGRDHVGETGKLPSLAELRGDSELGHEPVAEPAAEDSAPHEAESPATTEPQSDGEAVR